MIFRRRDQIGPQIGRANEIHVADHLVRRERSTEVGAAIGLRHKRCDSKQEHRKHAGTHWAPKTSLASAWAMSLAASSGSRNRSATALAAAAFTSATYLSCVP